MAEARKREEIEILIKNLAWHSRTMKNEREKYSSRPDICEITKCR